MLGRILLTYVMLGTAHHAWAQGTVADGRVGFSYLSFSSPMGGGNNVRFTLAPGAPGHVYQSWWWLRIAADTLETQLRNPDAQAYDASTLTLQWADVDATGRLSAQLSAVVSEAPNCGGALVERLTLTNLTNAALQVKAFAYLDADLSDTAFDDQATLESGMIIHVFDSATSLFLSAPTGDALQVSDTQGTVSLRNLLEDASPTELDGTGLPFAPPSQDFDSAYQWTRTLALGASVELVRTIDATHPLSCESTIFRNGFEETSPPR